MIVFRKRSGKRSDANAVDYTISEAFNHFAIRHDGFEDLMRLYAIGSQYLFVLLIAVVTVVGLAARTGLRRNAGVLAGVSAAAALLVAQLINAIADRPRPFLAHHNIHDFLQHTPDPGMPSDHATAAFAIATAVLLIHRRTGVIALVAATVMVVGRVVLGVHYPSDVLVGALLGAATATAVYLLTQRPTWRLAA